VINNDIQSIGSQRNSPAASFDPQSNLNWKGSRSSYLELTQIEKYYDSFHAEEHRPRAKGFPRSFE